LSANPQLVCRPLLEALTWADAAANSVKVAVRLHPESYIAVTICVYIG